MEQSRISLLFSNCLHYSSEIHPYVGEFLYLCAKSKGKLHPGIKKQTSSFYSASGLYYLCTQEEKRRS